jgi:hypothetical protein
VASVPRAFVHHVQQRLAGLEPAQILAEQIRRRIPVVGAKSGRVRSDEGIGKGPQRAVLRQRFVLWQAEKSLGPRKEIAGKASPPCPRSSKLNLFCLQVAVLINHGRHNLVGQANTSENK